jgi:hypothetical protein
MTGHCAFAIGQYAEQRLGLLQIGRVEALAAPAGILAGGVPFRVRATISVSFRACREDLTPQ